MTFDICIIGGGAAGLMAAVVAKQQNKNLNIAIIERLDRVGKKLALTGNGRCNITNRDISVKHYYGNCPKFCENIFSAFNLEKTEEFFESIGIPIIYEGNKGYPASLQAASVSDALRFKCDELGVVTLCGTCVSEISKKGQLFTLTTEKEKLSSRCIIAAGGMHSGGEKLGCDGSLFGILKRMGHKAASPSPAIVQLRTETDYVKQLKGIKIDAAVSLKRGKNIVKTDFGEVLFCDYGLSGPPILQISGFAQNADTVSLDIMPSLTEENLYKTLLMRKENLKNRKNDEFLSGLFNKRLGQVILKRAGCFLNDSVATLTDAKLKSVCKISKDFECVILGDKGFVNSQATRGGILTEEFFDNTLMSKKITGLFAAGEIIDIVGDCGGFNLQWAWSSAYVAAMGAADYLERN